MKTFSLKGGAKWNNVICDQPAGETPGPRHNHTMVVYGNQMFLYGGMVSTLYSSDDLFIFDFDSSIWKHVQTKGKGPGKVDSHKACIYADTMIIYGGFMEGKEVAEMYSLDLRTF